MGYRRNNKPARLWRQWKAQNKTALDICGLPEIVLEDEASWLNYLEHGFFEDFKTEDLSKPQTEALYAFLETAISEQEKKSLIVWLEVKRQLGK